MKSDSCGRSSPAVSHASCKNAGRRIRDKYELPALAASSPQTASCAKPVGVDLCQDIRKLTLEDLGEQLCDLALQRISSGPPQRAQQRSSCAGHGRSQSHSSRSIPPPCEGQQQWPCPQTVQLCSGEYQTVAPSIHSVTAPAGSASQVSDLASTAQSTTLPSLPSLGSERELHTLEDLQQDQDDRLFSQMVMESRTFRPGQPSGSSAAGCKETPEKKSTHTSLDTAASQKQKSTFSGLRGRMQANIGWLHRRTRSATVEVRRRSPMKLAAINPSTEVRLDSVVARTW